jgi:hypothetical protein
VNPHEAQKWALAAALVLVAGSLTLMAAIAYGNIWLAVAAGASFGGYGLAFRIRYRQYTDLNDERLVATLRHQMRDM